MRIQIVPDIHEAENVETDLEAAIARENPDVTVFLGDYFDKFYDTPEIARKTALWLKESLRDTKRIHLFGNHDVAYCYPKSANAYCAGFTLEKSAAINEVLGPEDWAKMRCTHWHENVLFSHAGWSLQHALPEPFDLSTLRSHLEMQELNARANLEQDKPHWFYAAGWRRGGVAAAGGILWCDRHEFTPIPGIHQIFGHTPGNLATKIAGVGSVNLCLDTTDQVTGVNHYILLEAHRAPFVAQVKGIRGTSVKEVKLTGGVK